MTRFADKIIYTLGLVSGLIAAFVMTVTFVGVIMRYIFRNPLMGGFEMIEIGMGLIVFTAIPLMVRRGRNIRVTLVTDHLSPAARRVTDIMCDLIGVAVCLLIAWRVWLQGERLGRYHEVTMELRVPKGLIAQSMSVMLLIAAVAFLLCAIDALRGRSDTHINLGPL